MSQEISLIEPIPKKISFARLNDHTLLVVEESARVTSSSISLTLKQARRGASSIRRRAHRAASSAKASTSDRRHCVLINRSQPTLFTLNRILIFLHLSANEILR